MILQSLTGSWNFRQVGTAPPLGTAGLGTADTNMIEWLPATVPGGVHTDLLALGRIPDPFVGDNENSVQWVAETDWEYRRTFTASEILLAEQKIFLICDGLDTIADVYLNDIYLGHTENMFRKFEWQVKDFLRPGENELRIYFSAPVSFIRARQAQPPLQGGGDIPGGPHGALPLGLGLGSQAAHRRGVERYPPGRPHRSAPGERAPSPVP